MTTEISNNKRIAKNTLMLYARTFITIIVSLYTSRIILQTLGETDFGIYNIVGGVVVLFNFVQNAMTSAVQRFLNVEMSKKDNHSVNKLFNTSIIIHIMLVFVFLIFAETIGVWFIRNILNIPDGKETIVMYVFQLSILTTCINILRTPYNAMIIANEEMGFFAYTSIIESGLKLTIAFLIIIFNDKLIAYSSLIALTAIIMLILYYLYTSIKYKAVKLKFHWDKELIKKITSFAGWSCFGSIADLGYMQGTNIILNIFHGVTLNTVVGITTQIKSAVYTLFSNFQMAARPQVVKLYAQNEYELYSELTFRLSKFSFFLILFVAIPLYLNIEYILSLWLVNIPKFTIQFAKLTIIFALIDSLHGPLWTCMQASGELKRQQLSVSLILLLNLPFTYIAFFYGSPPATLLIIQIILCIIALFARIYFSKIDANISPYEYYKKVIIPIIIVFLLCPITPIIIGQHFSGFLKLITTTISSCLISSIIIFMFGINPTERKGIISFIKNKL